MNGRRITVLVAAGALTLSGCGFKGLYSAPLPGGADVGSHPYSVTAYFADVLDLVPQSAVKVNDVAEGKVTKISLSRCKVSSGTTHWCAKVKMTVNGSVDLPSNSHAEVQQTSLLGEKYVQLIAPSPVNAADTKLHDGSEIAFLDTRSAPEAEQVLGALSLVLNNGGLTQIQNIAKELNKALGTPERRQAVRSLITDLTTFTKTLDNQKNDITDALANIDKLAITLNQQKQVLTEALDTFPNALRVLNQERGKLVTLLSSMSNLGSVATRVINSTQEQLVASLKALDPVVTRLAAAGSNFPGALRIAGTFPFPLGLTRQFIRGDYANLDAVFDLSLTDQLCGLLPAPLSTIFCNIPGGSINKTSGSKKTAKKTNDVSARQLPPMLIGAGSDTAMLRRSTKVQLIIFVVITLLGVSYVSAEYVGLAKYITGDHGCTIHADFPDSGGIFSNAEVTYRGVTVGKVGALHLISNGTRVDLKLDNCNSPKIPSNVSATVADRSVVGEQYVDLEPAAGTTNDQSQYLSKGDVIPMSRNHIPTATQKLLTSLDRLFNSVPLNALRTTISQLGKAVAGRGDDLGRTLDATDELIAVASQPENLTATTRLIDQSASVLQTQLDQREPLKIWTHNLNLLSQQLKASDPDFRHLLDTGPSDVNNITSFVRNNQTDIGVTLANLATVGDLLVRHLPGIEEIFMLYPALAAGGPTTVHDNTGWLGLVLQSSPDPQDCGDPNVGREGYYGTTIRTPFRTGPMAPNTSVRCTAPATGKNGKSVRGSAHVPGGDPISLSGGGYAYPRTVTKNTLRVGNPLPTSDTLGDASWLGLLTDALH